MSLIRIKWIFVLFEFKYVFQNLHHSQSFLIFKRQGEHLHPYRKAFWVSHRALISFVYCVWKWFLKILLIFSNKSRWYYSCGKEHEVMEHWVGENKFKILRILMLDWGYNKCRRNYCVYTLIFPVGEHLINLFISFTQEAVKLFKSWAFEWVKIFCKSRVTEEIKKKST